METEGYGRKGRETGGALAKVRELEKGDEKGVDTLGGTELSAHSDSVAFLLSLFSLSLPVPLSLSRSVRL